ncbi:hypothetical protein [Ureibacillus massiliensis]|uniref:hypothetical protein n=1 Tax=Ureibacillus massiliensis TaxID=292806 RepID=UPI001130B807|nr:hypothetical protein [Ureibacillus massiliensis]
MDKSHRRTDINLASGQNSPAIGLNCALNGLNAQVSGHKPRRTDINLASGQNPPANGLKHARSRLNTQVSGHKPPPNGHKFNIWTKSSNEWT